ncbi:iron-regulated protein FrpA [Maritalea myrionectae]|uniref:Iron-regulated protein FrpA n=1 Tax=Maritalea myrionectae TaxID=454601 RepID=A0A2R4MC13_9HYPH|nr:tandem-95 repeat protein [Maritalea myrionectae]AVX03475.1 iron-regulated protein FrpA [Maritalea myrionectae]
MEDKPIFNEFGFQTHHIFSRELYGDARRKAFLDNTPFGLDARGNKIGLFVDPDIISVISSRPSLTNLIRESHFGLARHDSVREGPGLHNQYNNFLITNIDRIRANDGLSAENKVLALASLHRFGTKLARGEVTLNGARVEVTGNRADIVAAFGNEEPILSSDLAVEGLTPEERSSLSNYVTSFDGTKTDSGQDSNSQARKELAAELAENALASSELNQTQKDNQQTWLDKLNADTSNSKNYPASLITALLADFKANESGSLNINQIMESMAASLNFALDGALAIDELLSKVRGMFDQAIAMGDKLINSLGDFGDDVIHSMAKNLNSVLVGVGGGLAGDAVEFLNIAYDSIKVGVQTGDWTEFVKVSKSYGSAALVGALLMSTAVVVAGAVAGPVAATFVAAGFAAYGLYEVVVNGAELLGKISEDIARVISEIDLDIQAILSDQQHASGLERLADAVTLIFLGARSPEDIAPHELAYAVDNLVASLPDSVRGTDESELFFGRNNAEIYGGGGVDEIHHTGHGKAYGEDGNDYLRGANPNVVEKGELLDPSQPEPEIGEPDNRERAETQLRLVLDGGKGDDYVMAFGGEGAILVGGEGRDFLFNTSYKGQLYGDTLDGVGQSTSGAEDSDVFWYWPSTFIMDAQPNDILQMFGLPLLGGSNFGIGNGGLAIDWLNPTVFYGATKSGQLLVISAIELAMDKAMGVPKDQQLEKSAMVVENYDYGGWKDAAWGQPAAGDLGMTFRIFADRDDSVEISVWHAVWGTLLTYLDVIQNFAKMVRWQPADDPLVLDLDGDGIETVSQSQSGVHFDLNGDYFAEQTGWIGADDGFLVMDRNNNGVIDDISEMFGAPDVGGYQELAAVDAVENGGNADGVITIDDALFAELKVWRDLDQDGLTDADELFSLDELDITSLELAATEMDHETPQGTTLRAGATFTRGDGSVGDTYEALFETDATDTIFRGDKGVAEWLKSSSVPTAKGFGAMAELAVDVSNDFELGQVVMDAANVMTVANLKDIRDKATPVFGAWAQAMELTRELTPVLLSRDAEGNATLLDRGVYVEDETGGFWTLDSGNPILDTEGAPIARASLEDVLAMGVAEGQQWQLEQVFSPSSRAEALQYREEVPYLVEIVDERPVVLDYGIQNEDGSWRLASGADITDSGGNIIAHPTREDILALPRAENTQWRVEKIDHNPYADLPVDQIGVNLVDGVVVDYSVAITDADGTFYVWARNLDRALELQHKLGRPDEFNLRNYELDFDAMDEVGSTDDSAYRVELMTAGQLHFASSIFGIDFQPQIMSAQKDAETGLLTYTVGSFNGEDAPTETEEGQYFSTIKPAIELFDVMMQNYISVSRGFAVRLAMQGGLADLSRELAYDPDLDQFRATGDRELAPMFEAIFAAAPTGAEAAYDYLVGWQEILEVIYPDYHLDSSQNILTGTLKLDQKFVFQMLIPAFENVGIDVELDAVMNALGVDETLLVSHESSDVEVIGTSSQDFFYLTGGDQTYRGGYGQDIYFVGQGFGLDIIDDREEPFRPHSQDEVRFTQAKSTDIFATMDGRDLVLEIVGTDDVLRIKDQFLGDLIDPLFGFNFAPDTGVSSIVFADGVIWNALEIAQAVSHPLDSDDLVLGSEERDWIEASRGQDVLRGGRDGDIYIFREGDGSDRIDDANDRPTDDPIEKADILQFVGSGISPENVRYERAGESDDLVMVLLDDEGNETGDRVQIDNQFNWVNVPFLGLLHGDRIERIAFEDGTFLTETDVMARVLEDAKTDQQDIIYGFNNADVLDGGAGNDVLRGRAQSDTYIYGRDYGRDVIDDGHDDFFGTGFDILRFKDDLRWSDFEFIRDGSSATITMKVVGTDDEVVLKDQFKDLGLGGFGFANLIEEIQFGDGTDWSYAHLAQHVINLARTDNDDLIFGFDISDRLDGGLGNDRLEGGAASDIYVFARGYGDDVIFDSASSNQGDVLVFQDIAFLDVDISRDDNDLIFTVRDTGERVIVEDQYVRSGTQTHAVEAFKFTDQEVSFESLNPSNVDLIGTSGSDILTGSDFAETIDGRAGDDTLIGNSDGDTYLFGVGYGNDVIIDDQKRVAWSTRDGKTIKETDDRVLFGSGVNLDNLIYTKDGDDLLISIDGRSDTLRIKNQFNAISKGIEWFEYASGDRLHISDVEERLAIVGGSRGDDVINGALDAENVLDGRQGDDQLYGGKLGDTYAFGAAYDLDQIIEREDGQVGAIDRIVFGSLVNPETIQLLRDGNNLIFDLGNGEDRLTVVEGLSTRQVERFLFANGTEWNLEDVRNHLLKGSNGDDVLIGFDDRNDRIDGGGGSDVLSGGKGDDTYLFGVGSGDDSIEDIGGLDKVEFRDAISVSQVRFSRQDNDLLIQLKDTSDTLIIVGGAETANSSNLVEQFVFSDGTVLEVDNILKSIVLNEATSGHDVIDVRGVTPIEIDPGLGDDLVYGSDQTTMSFYAGDGSDIFDTQNTPGESRIHFYDLDAADAVVRKPDLDSSDILIAFPSSGDQVLVRGALSNSNLGTIQFSSGVEWKKSDLIKKAIEAQQSHQGDAITGSIADDLIEGGLGDDDIQGGAGNDTYIFWAGDGHDVISDVSGIDRVEIRGYQPSDVKVTKPFADKSEWLLRFGNSSDEILLRGAGIEIIGFGDGTEWSFDQIQKMALNSGTQFQDVLIGTELDDTLVGLEGDDQLSGRAGNDSYIFKRGDGRDIIDDNGASSDLNTLSISDYTYANTEILRFADRPDDLVLRFSEKDEILVVGAFVADGSHIHTYRFADGEEVSIADIQERLDAEALGTDQLIEGAAGPDTLLGGLGDDILHGNDGSDTYVFRRGDGHDVIEDNGAGDTDIVRIEGFALSEARFVRDPLDSDSVIIQFFDANDQIIIRNGLHNGYNSADRIEEYHFADGEIVTAAQMANLVAAAQQSDGDDLIVGQSGWADTLIGGLGDDRLQGLDGSDTYVFRRGDGQDFIEDNGAGDTDVLRIEGFDPSETVFLRDPFDNDSVIVRFISSQLDQITIRNALHNGYNSDDRIEEYHFDNGEVLTARQVVHTINIAQSTDGDDHIVGYSGWEDSLQGGAGDDSLQGLDGSDTYYFLRGDGHDVIEDNGAGDRDVVILSSHEFSDARFMLDPFDADSLIIKFVGSDDQITVRNGLHNGYNSEDRIEEYHFGLENVYTVEEIVAEVNATQQTDGDDRIIGQSGWADTLAGGLGDDRLHGLDGADTYVFRRGDGHDLIEDNGAGDTDIVRIEGYALGETVFALDPFDSDSVIITFVGTDDQITVRNGLNDSYNSADRIEEYHFDGGEVLTVADVISLLPEPIEYTEVSGTSSSDTLESTSANERFDGGGGNDTYIYNRGDGHDIVGDSNSFGGNADKLILHGIAVEDVRVSQSGNHAMLIIAESAPGAGDGGTIRIDDFLSRYYERSVETIEFDDGNEATENVVWTPEELRARLIAQSTTPDDDVLPGFTSGDVYEAGPGDDILAGDQGDDTYIYNRGDGNDIIREPDTHASDADKLILRGIFAEEVQVSQSGNHAILIISESAPGAGDGGSIWIDDFLSRYYERSVETIEFDDGNEATENVVWTPEELRARLIAQSTTPDDDVLPGFTSGDVYEAGPGDDILAGDQGDDTYIYNRGDGNDIIREPDTHASDADKLILRGIFAEEVQVSQSGNHAILIISESAPGAGDGGSIWIDDFLSRYYERSVETIEFDDGNEATENVVWTPEELRARLIAQSTTPDDDVLPGFTSGDVYEAGPGDDILAGDQGDDTYIYNRGDGNDIIREPDTHASDADKLILRGISAEEVQVSQSGNHAILIISESAPGAGDGGSIRIDDFLSRYYERSVETIEFDDGDETTENVVWDYLETRAQIIKSQSTDGDDPSITGFAGDDEFDGGAGNDTIVGAGGNDTYFYSRGDGNDLIIDDAGEQDAINFSGVDPSSVIVRKSVGNDLELIISESFEDAGDGGRIIVRNSFQAGGEAGIERVVFDDAANTVWTRDQFETLATRNIATIGDDRLTGTAGADVMAGLAGNDLLIGGQGDDVYRFVKGDGQDRLRDAGDGVDTVEIVGFSLSELEFARRGRDGSDLIIRTNNSDEITIINGLLADSPDTIENFVIVDDGISLSFDDVMANLVLGQPNESDNQIIGTDGDDKISGFEGVDLLLGGAGDDEYLWRAGDGDDRIVDNGSDLNDLVVLSDTQSTELVWARRSPANGDDLVLRFSGARDRLTIVDSLNPGHAGIEEIEFADGIFWQWADMRAAVMQFAGTSDAETIRGFDGDDLVVGRQGDDLLIGGAGDDTYHFGAGDGNETIDDQSTSMLDRLEITDLLSSEASVERLFKGSETLVIRFAGNVSDSITIKSALSETGEGIETLAFADGVEWTRETLLARLENSLPTAVDDGIYTVKREQTLILSAEELLRNDFDPDGDILQIIAVDGGENGIAQIDGDGNIAFTGQSSFTGPTTFTYTASDGLGGFSTGRVSVRVSPPASARDDFGFEVDEDGYLTIDTVRLLSNDADGDRMIISQVFDAQNGSASLSSNGQISFTPTDDYNGLASFKYVANTPEGGRTEAIVYINVRAQNDAPIAFDDLGYTTDEDVVFSIDTSELLANDIDIDGDALNVTGVFSNEHLQVELTDDGVILVTPTAFFFGDASFEYMVSDTDGEVATATVGVYVNPVNDVPEPQNDALTIDEDNPYLFNADELLANDIERDGDLLEVTSVRNGSGGIAKLYDNGTILFTPNTNFFGEAYFFYTVDDGQGGLAEARVDLQVNPVNDVPNAQDESYREDDVFFLNGTEDIPLSISISDLLANDYDIDSSSLEIVSISTSENGLAEISGENIIFTPDADYWGEATFNYVVSDGELVDDARVTLYFGPVGDAPPVAANDSVSIYEDVATTISAAALLGNDTDIDRDELSIISVSMVSGAPGTVELDENGDVIFTPALNSNGPSFFNYVVSDNADGEDSARVRVDVIPVNDAPTANADIASTSLDAPLILRISDLLANDVDVDNALDELSFDGIGFASDGGSYSVYNDEFVVVEYAQGFSGEVSLEYTISDIEGIQDDGVISALISDDHLESLNGTNIRDLIIGTHLTETILGFEGNDDLFGRAGDDLIDGGDGGDRIDGGDGFDTVRFTGSNVGVRADLAARLGQGGFAQGDIYFNIEALRGTLFGDELLGDAQRNELEGLEGNDRLEGRDGDDQLDGGLGDDWLIGGQGADTLFGGDGVDTSDYSSSGEAVQISLLNGMAQGGHAEGDQLAGIENLVGSAFDDELEGDASANRLIGGRGNDLLFGGAGDDTLIGGRGADQMFGGDGIDRVEYTLSDSGVTVNLSDASSGGGDAQGDVFSSIELIVGSFHDDVLLGDEQDNVFMGGRGADVIDGGLGFDTADYSEADEAIALDLDTGLGSLGEAVGDQLTDIEKVVATVFDDEIHGSAADEVFFGGLGDDVLAGRFGSDIYEFGFGDGADIINEIGAIADIDRLVVDDEIRVADISLLREGDDLIVEFEQAGGINIDTVRVSDHFLGRETGIEEIQFAEGSTWGREQIEDLIRIGRFNAQDDIIRFADEDVELVITADRLLRNDADEGVGLLEIVSVEAVSGGTVSLNDDGSVSFVGDQDHFGDAFFDYTVRDPYGRESIARAEVNILPINDAPVAADDGVFIGLEDTALYIPLAEVFSNDLDVDGDPLTIVDFGPALDLDGNPLYASLFYNGSNGQVRVVGDQIKFEPLADHFGYAGFRYTVSDGNGGTATAQVELNFLGVNDAPRPVKDNTTVRLGLSKFIEISSLLANDQDPEGDAISFVTAFSAVNGTIELLDSLKEPVSDPAQAVFVRFDADELGEASFSYTVVDEFGASADGNVNINVIPLNRLPVARDDGGYETLEDQVIIIDPAELLANDSDPDGDTLTILELEDFPLNGKVSFNDEGMIEFTPRTDYNGVAGFTYTVTDGKDLDSDYPGIDTAFVSISIVPDNDAPQLKDDVVEGLEDLPITVIPGEAFANDLDPDGDVIFFESARFIGVLQNDFTNRAELGVHLELDSPVLASELTEVVATLADGAALPEWLSFDPTALSFIGTPPDPSMDPFSVNLDFTYTDPDTGEDVSYQDSFLIEPADAAALSDGVVYQANLVKLTGGTGTWSAALWTGMPLPSWLQFNTDTQEFSLTGIEPATDEPVARVRVEFDPEDANAVPYAVEVRIDPHQPIDVAINELFDQNPYFAAQGKSVIEIADDATVTAQEANFTPLPDWLSFDSNTLSFIGTPPEKYVGTVSVRVDVSESVIEGTPAFSIVRDIVVDETLVLTSAGGFQVNVFDELLDLVTPEDFFGAFAIEYFARDTKGAISEDSAVIVVNVEAQAELPDALDDNFSLQEDSVIEISIAELLANDYDDDGDLIQLVSVGAPTTGTLQLNIPEINFDLVGDPGGVYYVELQDGTELPDWLNVDQSTGTLRGTPPIDYAGTLNLRVTRTDDEGAIESNQDLDVDGNAGATILYTPDPEYSGSVEFQYEITDNAQGSATGTVHLDVLPANDGPVAEDDLFAGLEDTVLVLQQAALLVNDTDVDGDILRVSSVSNAVNGSVEIIDGEIVFTPNHNFDGIATFEYLVVDDKDGEDTGTVTIDVAPNNSAPVTQTDYFEGFEDTSFSVTLAQILANDTDPDGDEIIFVSFSSDGYQLVDGDPVLGGQADKQPDGSWVFTPRENLSGLVEFTYEISDGRLNSIETGNLVIDFTAINDAPQAQDDGDFVIGEDESVSIDLASLLSNDTDQEGDSLVVTRVLDPVNGGVEIVDNVAVFTPRSDYFGNAGFSYEVADGQGGFDIAYVSIFVTPAQDLPFAVSDDGYTIDEDSFIDISISELMSNDFDPDGDTISFVGVSGATQIDDDTIRFTPTANSNGRLQFSYSITDGNGPAVSTNVFVDVVPINDDPTAIDDKISSEEDQVVTIAIIDLLNNDFDIDHHGIHIEGVHDAVGGEVRLDGIGNVVFTPDENYSGHAGFKYTLQDVTGATDVGVVDINISALNDAPLAVDDGALVGLEDQELIISTSTLLENDKDVDGDELTIISVQNAEHGQVEITASGDIVFTPDENYNGPASFSYTTSDGELNSTANVTLELVAENDAPIAMNDAFDATEDEIFVIPVDQILINDSDLDGDPLEIIGFSSGDGYFAALDDSGNMVVTFSENTNGEVLIGYSVSDGELTDDAQITINVAPVNDAPTIRPLEDVHVTEDTSLDFAIPDGVVFDVDGDELSYTATRAAGTSLPDWLSFDATTRRFTGTPPSDFFGTISLALHVSDGAMTSRAEFDLVIDPVNDAPTISMPFSDRFIDEDELFSIQLQQNLFSDVDGDTLEYSFALRDGNNLPDWLNVDSELLKLSGMPPEDFNGSIDIEIAASDGKLSVSDIFKLTVNPVNDAPVVINPLPDILEDPVDPDNNIYTGESFVIEIPISTFEDVDGDPIQLAATLSDGSALPEWLEFDGSKVSGNAPTAAAGTYEVTIHASDGSLETSDDFYLTILKGNNVPVANDDGVFDTRGEIPIRISPAFLLQNDTDDDGDVLQFVSIGQGTNGSVAIDEDSNIVYTADSGFIGSDQFEYKITDGQDTSSAIVSVNVGEAVDNQEEGTDGTDVLIGDFTGDNYLSGGAGNDFLLSGRGNDLLYGGAGSDLLLAGSGDDLLDGGSGDDVLLAGRGDDSLDGGAGADLLFGGGGSDTFTFETGDGSDTIIDFETSRSGRRFSIAGDVIRLSVDGIDNFDDLFASAQEQDGGVLFAFGNGDELFLAGTKLAALDQDSFSFF